MQQELANLCGIIDGVADSDAIKRLRQLAAKRKRLEGEIDAATEQALRDGEFVEDIADALGASREKVRRFRVAHEIADPRETRRAKGAAFRREG
jgi:hypothetical protein